VEGCGWQSLAYQCQDEERPRGSAPRRCRHLFSVCGNPVLWLLVVDAGHRRLTAQAWGTRPSDATACSLPRASGRGHPRPLCLPAGLRLETLVEDPGGLGDVRWPGEDAVEQRVEVRVAPGSFFGLWFVV
jgi:hypothetical protein